MFGRVLGVAVMLSGVWTLPAFAATCAPYWTLMCSNLDPVRNLEEMLGLMARPEEGAHLSVDEAGHPFVRYYVRLMVRPDTASKFEETLETKASALAAYGRQLSAEAPDQLCWSRTTSGSVEATDLNKFVSAGATVEYRFSLRSIPKDVGSLTDRSIATFQISDCGRP